MSSQGELLQGQAAKLKSLAEAALKQQRHKREAQPGNMAAHFKEILDQVKSKVAEESRKKRDVQAVNEEQVGEWLISLFIYYLFIVCNRLLIYVFTNTSTH